MFLDRSDYVMLRRKSRGLAILWAAGDLGYRIGKAGALVSPSLSLAIWMLQRTAGELRAGFGQALLESAMLFLSCSAVIGLSVTFKTWARKRGGTYDWSS